MRPLDFYTLGLRMASAADTEAECRTAIGRLYYGLHHEACCRYFRENPGAAPLGWGSRHRQLIDKYNMPDNAVAITVSQVMGQLSRMRNIADYELAASVRYNNRQINPLQLMRLAAVVAIELHQALNDYSPGDAPDGCSCPTALSPLG